MNAIKTIQDMLVDARRRGYDTSKGREAMKWLATKSRTTKIKQPSALKTTEDRLRTPQQLTIGRMYMFTYDPKTKNKLPYYDRFPCIFVFNITPKLIYGINLHYLPFRERMMLMEELYKLESNTKLTANKKLKMSWELLKALSNFPLVKPCVKSYLPNHFRSTLILVPYEEWPIAAFLPLMDWSKKSQNEVWADSKRIISKN